MKILIVKTSAIGDIVQTFPVIEYLRLRYPKATIHWVVEKRCAALVSAHPLIDAVIPIDTKEWRKALWNIEQQKETRRVLKQLRSMEYDLLFDLQGNSKSGLITAFARAKEKVGFGYHSVAEKMNLFATTKKYEVPEDINVRLRYLKIVQDHLQDKEFFTPTSIALTLLPEEEEQVRDLTKDLRSLTYMVCFGSKWRNKQLPEETLRLYLERIAKQQNLYFLFIYAGREEERIAKNLHAAFPDKSRAIGDLSFPVWQALMRHVQLVIAMDSAALHVCGTTNTPSFSIFGPSKSSVYKPIGDQHLSLQGICPYGRTFAHRCPVLRTCSTGACVRALTPEQILNFQNTVNKC
ncbi:MAG: glycosyltransferase family 9 protein [Chlamydiota bacterium]